MTNILLLAGVAFGAYYLYENWSTLFPAAAAAPAAPGAVAASPTSPSAVQSSPVALPNIAPPTALPPATATPLAPVVHADPVIAPVISQSSQVVPAAESATTVNPDGTIGPNHAGIPTGYIPATSGWETGIPCNRPCETGYQCVIESGSVQGMPEGYQTCIPVDLVELYLNSGAITSAGPIGTAGSLTGLSAHLVPRQLIHRGAW